MTEPWSDSAQPTEGPRCPWCSSELRGDPATCPSCGATLREEANAEIPGVTQLDPAAVESARPDRGRGLLGWLSGEYETQESANERAGVEPPSDAVRAEMARLEMEAIQAEIDAAAAEEAAHEAAERGALPSVDSTPPSEPEAPVA
jgi:hypothetical protein